MLASSHWIPAFGSPIWSYKRRMLRRSRPGNWRRLTLIPGCGGARQKRFEGWLVLMEREMAGASVAAGTGGEAVIACGLGRARKASKVVNGFYILGLREKFAALAQFRRKRGRNGRLLFLRPAPAHRIGGRTLSPSWRSAPTGRMLESWPFSRKNHSSPIRWY